MFKIEDEIHAEPQEGEYETFQQALDILKERTKVPWGEKPNRCPCKSWMDCQRQFQIIEYDNTSIPWVELDRQEVLTISAKGIIWDEKIKTRYNKI